jgi:altronate dehydratase large subunit
MTQLQGFDRPAGPAGARNHVFILPSVVCSALVARQIAEASGAVHVSHQHGCGHIGPDISQTKRLFVGLASNPNVTRPVVVSLGCETVQGNAVADELRRLGREPQFISIQGHGGNDAAREAGIAAATELTRSAEGAQRSDISPRDLIVGIVVSRADHRINALVTEVTRRGARVVIAVDRAHAEQVHSDAATIDIGDEPEAPVSVVRNAGSGAQLLGAAASCRAQILVDFPSADQPPLGFAVSPVISVASSDGLHRAIGGEFDLTAHDSAAAIWERVTAVYSGAPTMAEERGSAAFAIPRLIRTM